MVRLISICASTDLILFRRNTVLIAKCKIPLKDLPRIENDNFFDDMIKAVVDIDLELISLSAEMHVDLESFMLENGSLQKNLYGINIYFENGEIEFDSAINPPRNRAAGYPRVGRYVADPQVRNKIEEIVNKWIEL